VRTYASLIQYEQDFHKAQSDEWRLIPSHDGLNPITYERFAAFIAPFTKIDDSEVSPRYQYGELRLTRLNALAPFLFGRLIFHHVNGQWAPLLTSIFAWSLVAFVGIGTVLAAMQIELAVQALPNLSNSWSTFAYVCRWFSVLVLIFSVVVFVIFIAVLLFLFLHDIWFAKSMLRRKKSGKGNIAQYKSGVV
jgi:hypothetical protein